MCSQKISVEKHLAKNLTNLTTVNNRIIDSKKCINRSIKHRRRYLTLKRDTNTVLQATVAKIQKLNVRLQIATSVPCNS